MGISRYFTNQKRDEMVDLAQLKEMIARDDNNLADSIMRRAVKIRGTRPYWMQCRRELEAMVRDLKCPHVFLTFSAADMQWDDLYRHMPEYESFKCSTDTERGRLAYRLLQENPHIAAEYLDRRFQLFLRHVLKTKFRVNDFWYRYEWQARGSGHVHGFLWLENAPSYDDLAEFLEFWSPLAIAINPAGGIPPAALNPCSRPFDQRKNTMKELAELLNRVQRHTKCTTAYCLRKTKKTNEISCTFHFPFPSRETATVSNIVNPKWKSYDPPRNDPLLNIYNPTISMGWLANTDFTPCTDQHAVLGYIAKYCSKAETKSLKLADLVRGVLSLVSTKAPMHSLATKMMNKLIAERDWSAQEVCHHLLDRELKHSSRKTQAVPIYPADQQQRPLSMLEFGVTKPDTTYVEKYCARGKEQSDLTLYEISRKYDWMKNTFRRRIRGADKILMLYPIYPSKPQHPKYAEFCRVKMMLHHPFSSPSLKDLLTTEDGVTFETWQDAYQHCRTHHQHPSDPLDTVLDEAELDSETESLDDKQPDYMQYEEILNLRNPQKDGEPRARVTQLGHREKDILHDWLASKAYPINLEDMKTYIDQCRRVVDVKPAPQTLGDAGDPSILNSEQRKMFDRVLDHYLSSSKSQLLLQIDGGAGTGKSLCIDMISKHIYYHAAQYNQPDPVIRAAPTGVAAHKIEGVTLHSLLALPVHGPFNELGADRLTRLQRIFRHCKLLIIDEKSMLGLRFLYKIDSRLRAICAEPERYFGGMNILLCGDFAQLPPVGDNPLYSQPRHTSPELQVAMAAYMAFTESIFLTQLMRQDGVSNSAVKFRAALSEMRDGPISIDHWKFLQTRTKERLSFEEWARFTHSIRLYFRNADSAEYNIVALEHLDRPIMNIRAIYQGKGAEGGSEEDAGRLHKELLISVNSRVMLTWNL